ncbi:hypothetical protein FACS189472_07310 [Alphaproteobacteria bacterium]|nr:hypothetical protein FACS189472_07310 [Alphaproteobacteria bacterium]
MSGTVLKTRAQIEKVFDDSYIYGDEISDEVRESVKAEVTDEALAMIAEHQKVTDETVMILPDQKINRYLEEQAKKKRALVGETATTSTKTKVADLYFFDDDEDFDTPVHSRGAQQHPPSPPTGIEDEAVSEPGFKHSRRKNASITTLQPDDEPASIVAPEEQPENNDIHPGQYDETVTLSDAEADSVWAKPEVVQRLASPTAPGFPDEPSDHSEILEIDNNDTHPTSHANEAIEPEQSIAVGPPLAPPAAPGSPEEPSRHIKRLKPSDNNEIHPASYDDVTIEPQQSSDVPQLAPPEPVSPEPYPHKLSRTLDQPIDVEYIKRKYTHDYDDYEPEDFDVSHSKRVKFSKLLATDDDEDVTPPEVSDWVNPNSIAAETDESDSDPSQSADVLNTDDDQENEAEDADEFDEDAARQKLEEARELTKKELEKAEKNKRSAIAIADRAYFDGIIDFKKKAKAAKDAGTKPPTRRTRENNTARLLKKFNDDKKAAEDEYDRIAQGLNDHMNELEREFEEQCAVAAEKKKAADAALAEELAKADAAAKAAEIDEKIDELKAEKEDAVAKATAGFADNNDEEDLHPEEEQELPKGFSKIEKANFVMPGRQQEDYALTDDEKFNRDTVQTATEIYDNNGLELDIADNNVWIITEPRERERAIEMMNTAKRRERAFGQTNRLSCKKGAYSTFLITDFTETPKLIDDIVDTWVKGCDKTVVKMQSVFGYLTETDVTMHAAGRMFARLTGETYNKGTVEILHEIHRPEIENSFKHRMSMIVAKPDDANLFANGVVAQMNEFAEKERTLSTKTRIVAIYAVMIVAYHIQLAGARAGYEINCKWPICFYIALTYFSHPEHMGNVNRIAIATDS